MKRQQLFDNFINLLHRLFTTERTQQLPRDFFLPWQLMDVFLAKHRLGKSESSLLDLTFEMIGKLIYLDRKATMFELDIVELYMAAFLRLSIQQKSNAFRAMARGRSNSAAFTDLATRFFKRHGTFKRSQALIDVLIATAASDGPLDEREREVLEKIARCCNIRQRIFERLLKRQAERDNFMAKEKRARHQKAAQASGAGERSRQWGQPGSDQQISHKEPEDDYIAAYARLGCSPADTIQTVKAAYHQLVMKYHPDRATTTGQPEETIKYYTDRFREVQEAYELIEQRVKLRRAQGSPV